ncbi:hypothetical protein [Nonomuraea sp. NPDC005692]|uniref:dCTP deaminase n=1 Tax=Nonomuraea sp. NPDC005692 TaxID=3157168 RepID=UPI0033F099CB
MILTGAAIGAAIDRGHITIEPYDPRRLSPNAYDWRLGDRIRICDRALDVARPADFEELAIPETGQLLNGNRTIGALGIWVHVSAPLGHTGHAIPWTLEIRVARPSGSIPA